MNTRTTSIGAWLLFSVLSAFAATNEPVSIFMPDGQMQSQLLRVYVSTNLQDNDAPELTLLTGKFLNQKPPAWTQRPIKPYLLAPSQQWTETRDGIAIGKMGTLLLFDLRGAEFTLKPWNRVTPVLRWGDSRQTAIGERAVYLGNLPAAAVTAFLLVGALAVMVARLASSIEGTPSFPKSVWKRLLLNPQGRLSLSKTQAAFWTLCIGGMVICFGLTRLEVPAIPDQLVALMGLSLATRATIFITEQDRDNKNEKRETKPAESDEAKTQKNTTPITPRLSDLINSGQKEGNPVAITKAQMVFWTCIAGCLFCVKSLLNGELWEVPWQLVALMGISQVSYVIPPLRAKSEQGIKGQRGGG